MFSDLSMVAELIIGGAARYFNPGVSDFRTMSFFFFFERRVGKTLLFFIQVYLTCSVILVSGVQYNDSTILYITLCSSRYVLILHAGPYLLIS